MSRDLRPTYALVGTSDFFWISLGKLGGIVALTCMCPVRSMHRLRVHAEGDRRDLLARWLWQVIACSRLFNLGDVSDVAI